MKYNHIGIPTKKTFENEIDNRFIKHELKL